MFAFFNMKLLLGKTLGLISVCVFPPLQALSAAESSAQIVSAYDTVKLERLENEELSIRSDQSISRETKLQRLREIWQRQENLKRVANASSNEVGDKTTAPQSKQPTAIHSAASNPKSGRLIQPTRPNQAIRNDNLISQSKAIISILHQKMYVFLGDKHFREYPISTSKYGVGDEFGSYKTPTGLFRVYSKIGEGLSLGAVLKSRQPTREVVATNAKDRDPIVTRIIWLEGLESTNRHALERCIYIHGTPQERDLGRPASFGCVRMASKDVVVVYEMLPEQSRVAILDSLDKGTLKKLHYIEERRRS
jgi:hypothetical protein